MDGLLKTLNNNVREGRYHWEAVASSIDNKRVKNLIPGGTELVVDTLPGGG
jgi:hypothetical protein